MTYQSQFVANSYLLLWVMPQSTWNCSRKWNCMCYQTSTDINRIIKRIIIYQTVNGQSHRTIPTTWPYNILRYGAQRIQAILHICYRSPNISYPGQSVENTGLFTKWLFVSDQLTTNGMCSTKNTTSKHDTSNSSPKKWGYVCKYHTYTIFK